MLVMGARLAVVTDGSVNYWIHNLDPVRKYEIKVVKTIGGYYDKEITPENLKYVLDNINPTLDELGVPASANPVSIAHSVWQSVYIATRQSPERCFQTFVELFMYKLLSDYNLLPNNLKISALTADNSTFYSNYGTTQVEYYVNEVRKRIKDQVFPEQNSVLTPDGIDFSIGSIESTATMLPQLKTSAGKTSIINGHAFENETKNITMYL